MYAKVGATSTSIHLNKPSMQHSPTHWNSKNYEKSGLKTHLRELIFQNFLTQGKGTSLSLDPIPAQTRPYGTRCVSHSIFQISPPQKQGRNSTNLRGGGEFFWLQNIYPCSYILFLRLQQDPFPLYPGEIIKAKVSLLKVVPALTALK